MNIHITRFILTALALVNTESRAATPAKRHA